MEGLAGRAEATQVCSGSRAPATHPGRDWGCGRPRFGTLVPLSDAGSERGGVRGEPGAGGACRDSHAGGMGAKEQGRPKAYSTRYSQEVSHPSTN